MIDDYDIKIDSEWHRVSATRAGISVNHFLKEYVDDVSKEVERVAKVYAPVGPTGRLKDEGVVRTEGREGTILGDGGIAGSFVDPRAAAFGGGFSIRGGNPLNTGQFSGVDKWNQPGHIFLGGFTRSFYEATVELNPLVEHSKWVHEGTGIYGPHHSPIVPVSKPFLVFNWHGRLWHKKSVAGQKANPFLTNAFEYVNNFYSPAKLIQLRAEIDAAT